MLFKNRSGLGSNITKQLPFSSVTTEKGGRREMSRWKEIKIAPGKKERVNIEGGRCEKETAGDMQG